MGHQEATVLSHEEVAELARMRLEYRRGHEGKDVTQTQLDSLDTGAGVLASSGTLVLTVLVYLTLFSQMGNT